MNVIELNNGAQVRVSEEDYERLAGFSWCRFRNGRAYRKEPIPREERSGAKTHRTILLHRAVAQVTDDRQVIFLDGDPANCTRENLVVVDASFRPRQRTKKGGSSQFRGVGWNRAKGMWQAYLRVNGKLRHLGFFAAGEEGEREAARAYDEAARREFGDLAVLNLPPRTRRRRLVAHPAALKERDRPRLSAFDATPAVVEVEVTAPEAPVEELFNKPVTELTPEELELMKARFLGDRYRARARRLGHV